MLNLRRMVRPTQCFRENCSFKSLQVDADNADLISVAHADTHTHRLVQTGASVVELM